LTARKSCPFPEVVHMNGQRQILYNYLKEQGYLRKTKAHSNANDLKQLEMWLDNLLPDRRWYYAT
jgi:hypothetical protein